MRITVKQLRRIIKEELTRVLIESDDDDGKEYNIVIKGAKVSYMKYDLQSSDSETNSGFLVECEVTYLLADEEGNETEKKVKVEIDQGVTGFDVVNDVNERGEENVIRDHVKMACQNKFDTILQGRKEIDVGIGENDGIGSITSDENFDIKFDNLKSIMNDLKDEVKKIE